MPTNNTENTPPRYFLGRDNSAHWYVVRADKRPEWEAWCNIPEDDELSWLPPEFANALGGDPSAVTFSHPAENVKLK